MVNNCEKSDVIQKSDFESSQIRNGDNIFKELILEWTIGHILINLVTLTFNGCSIKRLDVQAMLLQIMLIFAALGSPMPDQN